MGRPALTEHLPNTSAVGQNMTNTVPSSLVVCGLLQSLTILQCGVSEELNTSGKRSRETCFRHLIPVVCDILLKGCSPFQRKIYLFTCCCKEFVTTWNNFIVNVEVRACSFDHTKIKIVSDYMSFRFSSSFLPCSVQNASFMSPFALRSDVFFCSCH